MSTTNKKMSVTIASHFFKVLVKTPEDFSLVTKFAKKFTHIETDKQGGPQVTVYAVISTVDNEFRFHINAFESFKNFLNACGFNDNYYELIILPTNFGKSVKLAMHDKFVPRPVQVPIIEYFLTKQSESGVYKGQILKQNFIGIQTGEGKTLTSSFCAVKLGKRILICVRPLFMKKWVKDIFEIYKVKKNETLSVQGSDQLKGLISIAKTKEFDNVKIILVSLPTMRNWIKAYETFGKQKTKELGYGCDPDEFYEYLGVGLRLIDEVHIDFHFNFIHDLFTNVNKSISLSATLMSMDPFMERMYSTAYPKTDRYNGGELKKYTRSFAVLYDFYDNRRIRTSEYGSNQYSQFAFEKSIMNKQNNGLLINYCGLIYDILSIKFLPTFKKGNKAVVYAASKKMCTEIANFLKKELPDYDVRRYIGSDPKDPGPEDPYENLIDPDIRVTTIQSGGTGHDIPGLTDVVMTNCIQSIQQNIQVLGRLREIPDGETRFYYLTCFTLKKQMKYHFEKMEMLKQRAKSFEILPYGIKL